MKYLKKTVSFILFVLAMDCGLAAVLLNGVSRFYGLNEHSEVLLIGHSHLMLATDKVQLERETGLSISKYTREGVTVEDRYWMVKQFLESPFSDSLQMVIYGVDAYSFAAGDLSQNSYTLFYPFMDDLVMDQYVKENAKDEFDYWSHKIMRTSRYSDQLLNAAGRGMLSNWENYKYGTVDLNKVDRDRRIFIDDQTLSLFYQTIQMITDRGIRVVLVEPPIVDVLIDSQQEAYSKVVGVYQSLASKSSLIEYWDFNHPPYSNDYSLFFDGIHLNPKGQKVISQQIGDNINRFLYVN